MKKLTSIAGWTIGRLVAATACGQAAWRSAPRAVVRCLASVSMVAVVVLCGNAALADVGAAKSAQTASFWRVEGKASTVWLFGSIHVLTKAHYPLADAVENAFENSPNLVVEVDVVNMDQASFQQTLMAEGRLAQGKTLRKMLGEQRYAHASQAAEAAGYDLDAMQGLHPWLVMLMVSMNEYMRMGYTPDQGVEYYFLQRANLQDKAIMELETVETQLRVFTEMGEKAEVAALMHTLDNLPDIQNQIRYMVRAWENGDLSQLEGQLLEEFADFPGAYQSLITDRNRNWVGQLKPILEHSKQDHFVAVGALHMVGEQGLVNLLRKEGYQVHAQ